MKVFLATAIAGREFSYAPVVERLAKADRFKTHTLTDDPKSADIILFLDGNHHRDDPSLTAIRCHPLTIAHREKTFLYNELDQPWCAMPGLYVSMETGDFNRRRQQAFCYLRLTNEFVGTEEYRRIQPDLLFSFAGRRCHRTRDSILALRHPRGLVDDTSAFDAFSYPGGAEGWKRRYAELLGRTKFVLCPRGAGTASFRLFETMAAGRVPVIISDRWAPPSGPKWDHCALRVPESELASIASIIEASESRFDEMARAARGEWEEWFSPEVLFHRMVESCREIIERRLFPEALAQRLPNARHLWLLARKMKWKVKQGLSSAAGRMRATAAA